MSIQTILNRSEDYSFAKASAQLGTASVAFVRAPTGLNAFRVGTALVGVIGEDRLINSLIHYSIKLAIRSAELDESAADEMVTLMQSRVPKDTRRLEDGIEKWSYDGKWTVQASAQRYSYTKDYARDVEFGTRPGNRSRRVADDEFFASPRSGRAGTLNPKTGRRFRVDNPSRKVRRDHPGACPTPRRLNRPWSGFRLPPARRQRAGGE